MAATTNDTLLTTDKAMPETPGTIASAVDTPTGPSTTPATPTTTRPPTGSE